MEAGWGHLVSRLTSRLPRQENGIIRTRLTTSSLPQVTHETPHKDTALVRSYRALRVKTRNI